MHSGGCNAHEHVADLDLGAVNELRLLHDSGSVAGNVIFPVPVHSRHLGSLTADEGAAGLAASLGNSGDNRLNLGRNVLSHSDIVEEEKRLGSLRQHVIDTHCNRIDADGVMLVHCKCQFELGSHAVSSADEDRFLDVQCGKVEHSAEGADVSHHARTGSGSHVFLDTADNVVSGFEAYACFLIIYCHSISMFLEFSFFVGILNAGIQGGRVYAAEAGQAEVAPPSGLVEGIFREECQ